MFETRESFFECQVASRNGRTALVQAWNAAEAELRFRDRLAEEGLTIRGTIVVTRWTSHPTTPRLDLARRRSASARGARQAQAACDCSF